MNRSFLLLLVVLPLTQLRAQTLLWGPELSCGTMSESNLRPRVQLNADGGAVVLWGRSSPAANFVAVGDGSAFSSAMQVSPADVELGVANWMGSSLAAEGNTIWAVMKVAPEDMNPCYVVRSDDGGYTWSDTMRVDPMDGLLSRFPSIVVVPGAGPVVQYMQFTGGFAGDAHYVTTRMVGGLFQAPVQVSSPFAPGEVCDCCPGQVVASGNTLVSLYRNAGSNIRVIWGGASSDGGATCTAGAQLDATDWFLDACPSSGPAAYITGDSIRSVWMSGGSGMTRVYLGSAHLPDLVPGAQRMVYAGIPSSTTQNYPRIAGSGDTLGIVWQQNGGGNWAILFSHSTTGAAGLSLPDTLAIGGSGAMATPDITFANGTFHIVWSDNSADVVRYRSATVLNTTGIAAPLQRSALRLWPVPASDVLFVDASLLNAARFEVVDPLGRSLLRGPCTPSMAVDVAPLASGSYTLRLFDAHSLGVAAGRFVKE